MAVEERAEAPDSEDGGGDEQRVSTIAFPWADLDNAVRVAKGIHNKSGTTLTLEQLAAELGVAVKGGGFRLMYSAAKTFGLVTLGQGNVTLTDLGRQINDPKAEKAARAQAFLNVPLYRAIFENHKGGTLPPASGLETEMANLGVVRKAAERARQVFQKSAQQAGFFAYGTDRLVLPATGGLPPTGPHQPPRAPDEQKPQDKHKGDGGDGGGRHPFIAGLLKELPNEGADWPTAERVKWLRTAAMLFDWIYKNGDNNTRPVRIEVSADSAK
ncbi:MAG TPA: hypothetical protein VJ813_19010 [Vicinamibacterales bacterium]|nr:hypothetical protein [Vicinamibacterales bacterium]